MAGVDEFIGSWRETTKDGFDEMAEQLGLPPEKKQFFKDARTEISYKRDGDQWNIEVGMQGVPCTRKFQFKLGEPYESQSIDGSPLQFKLGEPYESQSIDGSPLQSIMKADGCKFVESHKDESMNGMEMNIERHIEGGKMIVQTKVGPLQMKSTYERINCSSEKQRTVLGQISVSDWADKGQQ